MHAQKLAYFQFEEAAFLCEHRIALRSQPDFEWPSVGPVETRIEAHLRALRSVSLEALPGMTDQATLDVGEFCASMRVHACHPGLEAFEQQLAQVYIEDLPRIHLAAEALHASTPDGPIDNVRRWLTTGSKVTKAVGALLLGHRRESLGSDLISLARGNHPTLVGAATWALGRCTSGVGQAFFLELCEHDDRNIREIAGAALMRQFHLATGQKTLGGLDEATAPASVLALSATKTSSEVLRARFPTERTEQIVQAIGIAGDVSSVPILIELLGDDELRVVAAQALNLMTGANLHETIWIADETADAELLYAERIAYQADGILPARPDGLPFGFDKVELSKNPEVWVDWLEHNGEVLQPNCSIRLGRPVSAVQSLRTLTEHNLPIWARRAAADELMARYHISEPFEVEWMVYSQGLALTHIGRLIDLK